MTQGSYLTRSSAALAIASGLALATVQPAAADEGGVGFWVPGINSSLVAVPQQPGWGLAFLGHHANPSAAGGKSFVIGGGVTAGLDAHANLFVPS